MDTQGIWHMAYCAALAGGHKHPRAAADKALSDWRETFPREAAERSRYESERYVPEREPA